MKSYTCLALSMAILIGLLCVSLEGALIMDDDPYGKDYDGLGSRTIVWQTNDGMEYEYKLEIPYAEFMDSIYRPVRRSVSILGENYFDFLTPNESHVRDIAEYICGLADTDDRRALLALNFLQCAIEYAHDETTYGTREHFAYPIETLYIGKGDCEDKAFLLCSIMLAMGIDARLTDEDSHVGLAICLDIDDPNKGIEHDGRLYRICHTTASYPTSIFTSPNGDERIVDNEEGMMSAALRKGCEIGAVSLRYSLSIHMEILGIERGLFRSYI